MAFSSCFYHTQRSIKVSSMLAYKTSYNNQISPQSLLALEGVYRKPYNQRASLTGINLNSSTSLLSTSRFIVLPKLKRTVLHKKYTRVFALWLPPSQIANSVFTIGTAAVLPFYTLMVVAPRAELTKKSMESTIPYIILGVLYAYLLYLSWTPDTIRYMFSNQYLMPELSGIAKMFSNEMTLASAWIHLLAVDLFAARQVYHDGLQNNIETRHSVSLCLLFCPVGVLAHFITKAFRK